MKELFVREAKREDIRAIVNIHKESFAKYFLTQLGTKVVKQYYETFLDKDHSRLFVLEKDQEVAGFVAIFLDNKDFFRDFYKKSFLNIILGIFLGLRNSDFRTMLFKRGQHFLIALKSLTKPKAKASKQTSAQPLSENKVFNARLISVAIAEKFRGQGLFSHMQPKLDGELKALGIQKIGLSVFKSNTGAVKAYSKAGWHIYKETQESLYFEKILE